MDVEAAVNYWIESASHDWEVVSSLVKEKRFDWALFIGHLVLEKALKAVWVRREADIPPRTHNLVRLAEEAGIPFDDEDRLFLEKVNSFHLASRYPDEQMRFYSLCTEKFTLDNIHRIEEKYRWFIRLAKPSTSSDA